MRPRAGGEGERLRERERESPRIINASGPSSPSRLASLKNPFERGISETAAAQGELNP